MQRLQVFFSAFGEKSHRTTKGRASISTAGFFKSFWVVLSKHSKRRLCLKKISVQKMFGFQKYCLHLSRALVREISTLWCHKGRQLLVQVYDKTSNQVSSLLGRSNIASEFWQEAKTSQLFTYLFIYFAIGCKQRTNLAVVWGSVERFLLAILQVCMSSPLDQPGVGSTRCDRLVWVSFQASSISFSSML